LAVYTGPWAFLWQQPDLYTVRDASGADYMKGGQLYKRAL